MSDDVREYFAFEHRDFDGLVVAGLGVLAFGLALDKAGK